MYFFLFSESSLDFINNKIQIFLDNLLGYSKCQITNKLCQTFQTDKY